MNYDGFTLAAVAAELQNAIVRGRIQKIRQHNATDLTLEIRGVGHTYRLFLSADARFARVYLTAANEAVRKQAPNFCMLLRKHLSGAFVTAVNQVGMDRILQIHTESPDHAQHVLILELMGKHSNIILVNPEARILGAAKHVGSSISRYRQVLPGRDYLPPPGGDKADPRSTDAAAFDALWNESFKEEPDAKSVSGWLVKTFGGFGPFLAAEVVRRASADGQIDRDNICEEVLTIGAVARDSNYEPVFITGQRGEALMAYPMPSVQFPEDKQHARESINEALDTLFRSLVSHTELDDQRKQTLTAIRRAGASRKQTLKSIERTISESGKSERYKQLGELLIANLHAFEKGKKSITVVDYYDPAAPEIEIELDEKLTPHANAERYFKRSHKARDAAETAQQRKAHVLKEIGILEAAAQEAESAEDVDALKSLRKMLTDLDILRPEIDLEKTPAEEFGGERIRRIITPEGWEILYGENAKANDYLTQRVARPNDVWLHARQVVGAHVIIRTAGHKGGVPRPVLYQAARTAAQNCEAKHSSLVPVDHTLRKYVRKPRSSAPGFVTYRGEKTIDINPKA